jgi:hypothetical protein
MGQMKVPPHVKVTWTIVLCIDGSDESVATCKGTVDIVLCNDGSDESAATCKGNVDNRIMY